MLGRSGLAKGSAEGMKGAGIGSAEGTYDGSSNLGGGGGIAFCDKGGGCIQGARGTYPTIGIGGK